MRGEITLWARILFGDGLFFSAMTATLASNKLYGFSVYREGEYETAALVTSSICLVALAVALLLSWISGKQS